MSPRSGAARPIYGAGRSSLAVDEFTKQYIATALWSSDDGGLNKLSEMSWQDLAPQTLDMMKRDAISFQQQCAALLDRAYQETGYSYGPGSAGHDFWLTRNHHGAGFWDRGLGEVGNMLTTAAHKWPEVDLYVGDDGLVYAGGHESWANERGPEGRRPTRMNLGIAGEAGGAREESPVTKPGQYGPLYLYSIEYKDESDPTSPNFTQRVWAYNLEHAEDKFYESPDSDGWKIVSLTRVDDAKPEHRRVKHSPRGAAECGGCGACEDCIGIHTHHDMGPEAMRALGAGERPNRPGYYAVYPNGRIASGPYGSRDKADGEAKKIGGFVQFEAGEASEAGQPIDFREIQPGDRVTISNRFGQNRIGRVVMRGPAGWVLNMGGPHGTPDIATPENFVSASRSSRRGSEAAEGRQWQLHISYNAKPIPKIEKEIKKRTGITPTNTDYNRTAGVTTLIYDTPNADIAHGYGRAIIASMRTNPPVRAAYGTEGHQFRVITASGEGAASESGGHILYQTDRGYVTLEQTGKSQSYVVWINHGPAAVRMHTIGSGMRDAFARAKRKLDEASDSSADEKVSHADRENLPPSAFALRKRRALLLTDKNGNLDAGHVKAAAGRLSMMKHLGHLKPGEWKEGHARIMAAGKKVGLKVKEVREAFNAKHEAKEDFTVSARSPDEIAQADAARHIILKSPQDIYEFVAPSVRGMTQETFLVVPMDLHGSPLVTKPILIAMGQRDRVQVDPGDVVRPVIEKNAAAFVVCHQHPSGRPLPSDADKELTDSIREAARVACPSTVFLDHCIVGANEIYSFTDGKVHHIH